MLRFHWKDLTTGQVNSAEVQEGRVLVVELTHDDRVAIGHMGRDETLFGKYHVNDDEAAVQAFLLELKPVETPTTGTATR